MKIFLTTDAQKVAKQLGDDGENIDKAMIFAIFRAMSILDAEIRQNIRSRSGLHVRTGTLLNSIQQRIFLGKGVVRGEIGPKNVPYAAIHEFGGTIAARFVRPIRKQALKFTDKGGFTRFSKGHWIPQITIPKRAYMEPAIRGSADRITEVFGVFVEGALKLNLG